MIIALVPAHNESERLPGCLRALEVQTAPPDRVVVVSDNSTDATPALARDWGGTVELFETAGNRDKKAGALNQALAAVLPQLASTDLLLVVDADSRLAPGFIAEAVHALNDGRPTIGAVGGIFLTDDPGGALVHCQRNEYARYAREIARAGAHARVLTGTATMLRVGTLRQVARARASGSLPGAGYYNARALTEDFELTLALKTLGLACVSPRGCIVHTEAMDTPARLWRQRTRWQRGALEALALYGPTRVTLPYIAKQAQLGLGIAAFVFLLVVTAAYVAIGSFIWQPAWLLVGVVFYVERLATVARRTDRAGRVVAALLVPELVYDVFLMLVYLRTILLVLTRTSATWGTATIDRTHEGA